MPKFAAASLSKLNTCDKRLVQVFTEVVKHFDCTVLCGFRGEEGQNLAFKAGNSKFPWPKSEHNKKPSRAIDVVPYPIDWTDANRMRFFAGFVTGIAKSMGVNLRWGGDWDKDTELKDQEFNDLPHFEVKD